MADNTPQQLTPKQYTAIGALLSESTVAKAAAQAKVGERTLYRWLDDPTFADAYRKARYAAVHQAISRLEHASSRAVTVLTSIMDDTGVPARDRLAAARTVIEFSFKATDIEDFEERLQAMEQRYEKQYAQAS